MKSQLDTRSMVKPFIDQLDVLLVCLYLKLAPKLIRILRNDLDLDTLNDLDTNAEKNMNNMNYVCLSKPILTADRVPTFIPLNVFSGLSSFLPLLEPFIPPK